MIGGLTAKLNSGEVLTVDESIISWTGVSGAQIYYLKKKPHLLGIVFKILHSSHSRTLLNVEFNDNSQAMSRLEHVVE